METTRRLRGRPDPVYVDAMPYVPPARMRPAHETRAEPCQGSTECPPEAKSMSEAARLLELIEERIVAHGGDLGGWTALSTGELKLFDGRVTLRAEIVGGGEANPVHAHVFTTLHEHGDEVLDACVLGMGEDPDAALGQAATIWMQGVGAPIRSFLDDRPVCMASPAGAEAGLVLAGGRAYAGPIFPRGLDDAVVDALDETLPWFRFAAESAAPRRVHLAKVSIIAGAGTGWARQLEIDGHDVSHRDPDWPAGVTSARAGYVTRFAVFELSPGEVERRAELDRTIRHFAEHYARSGSAGELMDEMVRQGFDPDLVHETESISTIAFGRLLFEGRGASYLPTIIRARGDGRVEADVPLLSIPAYSRARALAPRLEQVLSPDDFTALCVYSAESNAILQAMEQLGKDLDLADITFDPCVVPDRDVSHETMDAALRLQQRRPGRESPVPPREEQRPAPPPRKPWWKVW